jgi:hypothetical protein
MMSNHFDEKFWLGKKHLEVSNKSVYSKQGILLNSEFSEAFPEVDVIEILLATK